METNENSKTPLELLLEAIDYSFLKIDGTYNKSLTMPVIDKVKWIKRLIEDSNRKKAEQAFADAQYKKDFPYTFDELAKNGVNVGDIVASKSSPYTKAVNFCLLRKGFPKGYNTSLCCDNVADGLHFYQIGFHYIGKPSCRFRKTTDEEKQMFIDACIKTLKTPIVENWGWQQEHYEQILGNMVRDGLISMYQGEKLSKELKKIHNVDLLKLYKKNYGFIK